MGGDGWVSERVFSLLGAGCILNIPKDTRFLLRLSCIARSQPLLSIHAVIHYTHPSIPSIRPIHNSIPSVLQLPQKSIIPRGEVRNTMLYTISSFAACRPHSRHHYLLRSRCRINSTTAYHPQFQPKGWATRKVGKVWVEG